MKFIFSWDLLTLIRRIGPPPHSSSEKTITCIIAEHGSKSHEAS